MDVFVYFRSPLPQARDVFEDALEEQLAGIGEVTGGGSGRTGSNIDVRISSPSIGIPEVVSRVGAILKKVGAPPDTVIDLEGRRYPLPS